MIVERDVLRPELPAGALLGLDGLRPVGIVRRDGLTEIEVEYYRCQTAREQGGLCDGCQVHDRRPSQRLWFDVPHRTPVALRPVPVRLRGETCSGTGDAPAVFDPRFHLTASAAEWALLASMKAPFAEVAREVGCSSDAVGAVFAAIRPALDAWRPQDLPKRLGIDGVHTHDGTYTVVAGLTPQGRHKGRMVDLLPTHQADKVEEIMMTWPGRETVEVVAIDPSSTLRAMVRRVFPNAKVVVDKRHCQRGALECAHEVRKHHAGAVDKERSRKAPEAPAKKSLARAIDKRAHRRTAEDRRLIEAAGGLVEAAYLAKERFYDLFDTCRSPSEAKAAVAEWWEGLDAGLLDAFRPVHRLVTETWRDEFETYFRVSPRVTTAFVESANRTLRGFEADARGNAGHARLRAQLLYRFGGLSTEQLKTWLAAAL